MPHINLESPQTLAESLQVSVSTVYRWIRDGKLVVSSDASGMTIPIDPNIDFFLAKERARWNREPQTWVPSELVDYDQWHQLLDGFCWLLKVCYSTPEEIKRKKFRLDSLFANYIRLNYVSNEKLRRVFGDSFSNRGLIISDLKRGWYNECSFAFPIRTSSLGLSFGDISANIPISADRFTFPSWRITSFYYSVYFYLRSLCVAKQAHFRFSEHGGTIAAFKNNLLSPLSRVLWRFPFSIDYLPRRRVRRSLLPVSTIPHLRYGYSAHPRTPHYTPLGLYEEIYGSFRKRSRKRLKPIHYTLLDYLHDFRVWANYLDIDNLLSLWGGGYKAFLDQNLSTILFFVGGFSELCVISIFGEKEYLKQLQSFYDGFVSNAPSLEEDFAKTPLFQRLQIFEELGFVRGRIELQSKPDPHAIVVTRL